MQEVKGEVCDFISVLFAIVALNVPYYCVEIVIV